MLTIDTPTNKRNRRLAFVISLAVVVILLALLSSIPAYTTPEATPTVEPNKDDCTLIVGPLDMLNLSRPVLWCRQ